MFSSTSQIGRIVILDSPFSIFTNNFIEDVAVIAILYKRYRFHDLYFGDTDVTDLKTNDVWLKDRLLPIKLPPGRRVTIYGTGS